MDYLIITALFFALLLYSRKKDNNVVAPNQMFIWYWFIQCLIIVPLCGFSTWEYSGLWYIVACLVTFSLPFWIFARGEVVSVVQYPRIYSAVLLRCIVLFTGLGIIAHIVSIFLMYDISIKDALLHLSTVSEKLYAIRAHGGEKSSILSKVSLILLYAYPILTGYYYKILKNKLYTIIGLLLILYVSLMLGTKAVFMTSCILWVAGWLVAFVEDNRILEKRYLLKSLFCGIILIALLVIGMFVKIYGESGCTVDFAVMAIHNIFANYAFAHLLAFDHWFANFTWEVFTGGQYTFFGIFNTLGLANREIGIFRDVLYIGSLHTNVYTVFRSIVTDFSPIGGLLFMALLGFIATYAYKKIRFSQESEPLAVTVLVMIYAFILWSFVTSVFAYASYICAFVYFYLCQKFTIWRSGC